MFKHKFTQLRLVPGTNVMANGKHRGKRVDQLPRFYLLTIASGRTSSTQELYDYAQAEGRDRYGADVWEQLLRERRYFQVVRDLRDASSTMRGVLARTLESVATQIRDALPEDEAMRVKVDAILESTIESFEAALREVENAEEEEARLVHGDPYEDAK